MKRVRQSELLREQGAQDNIGLKPAVMPRPKARPITAEAGFVLVLLEPVPSIMACDWGAAAILNLRYQSDGRQAAPPCLPEELVEIIRDRKPTDWSSSRVRLRIGTNEYSCRIHSLESRGMPVAQPIVALHLERDSSANDAICDLVDKYHLTDREQEVLRGVSRGLATKELAGQMNISPNTVKAFLRLVMIKMGVTKRSGIVAKILNSGAPLHEITTVPDTPAPKKVPLAQAAAV